MDKSPNKQIPIPAPLPLEFYSFATGKPFEHCVTCNTFLLEPGTQYMIEKAVIRYPEAGLTDVAFEYAMCLPCAEKMRQTLSPESLKLLENYFEQHADFDNRQKLIEQTAKPKAQDWIANCLLTNISREEDTEYQLIAHCDGTHILLGVAPYMISGKAADKLSELLSPKTKDILNDFIDDNFGLPPELKALIKEKNLVLF